MKKLLTLAYWIIAIFLLSSVIKSLGYKLGEAVFISTTFLPGALAVKYFFRQVSFSDRGQGLKDASFITAGILLGEILLFILAHSIIKAQHNDVGAFYHLSDLPEVLLNPIFIAIIIAVLAVGNYYFSQWVDKLFPTGPGTVSFMSDRKAVTLEMAEILYVESNDSVTTVVATGERRFRNKTPITQWEAILGSPFIRIHRSYLVNRSAISETGSDYVCIDGTELPVSRKYREAVRSLNITLL